MNRYASVSDMVQNAKKFQWKVGMTRITFTDVDNFHLRIFSLWSLLVDISAMYIQEVEGGFQYTALGDYCLVEYRSQRCI